MNLNPPPPKKKKKISSQTRMALAASPSTETNSRMRTYVEILTLDTHTYARTDEHQCITQSIRREMQLPAEHRPWRDNAYFPLTTQTRLRTRA